MQKRALLTTAVLRMHPSRALWSIAWPVIALGLVRAGYFLADTFWAGRMGDDAPAALSAMGGAAFATWILSSLADLSAVGTHALVARAAGAGDRGAIRDAATQGAWLSLALGVAVAVFARPLADGYFALVGFSGPAFEAPLAMGTSLLRVLAWGFSAMTLQASLSAVFRGLGDTRVPMILSATTFVVNAVLAPVLIFGAGIFPRLGLAGAAWATVFASGLGALLSLVALVLRGDAPTLALPRFATLGRIAAIGVPQAVSGVGFCLVYVLLGEVLTSFGPTAIAGLGIGHRVESIAYHVAVGFGAGAATMVGQHLGAGDPLAATRAANLGAKLAALAMLPFMAVFVLAPRALVALWALDPETLARGSSYLLAAGAVLVLMALEVVYESAFAGAGETMPALLVALPLTAARIPAAAWLASHTTLGIEGIWLSIALSTAAKGLLLWALHAWRAARRSSAPLRSGHEKRQDAPPHGETVRAPSKEVPRGP